MIKKMDIKIMKLTDNNNNKKQSRPPTWLQSLGSVGAPACRHTASAGGQQLHAFHDDVAFT
jgi:hypothetical protein